MKPCALSLSAALPAPCLTHAERCSLLHGAFYGVLQVLQMVCRHACKEVLLWLQRSWRRVGAPSEAHVQRRKQVAAPYLPKRTKCTSSTFQANFWHDVRATCRQTAIYVDLSFGWRPPLMQMWPHSHTAEGPHRKGNKAPQRWTIADREATLRGAQHNASNVLHASPQCCTTKPEPSHRCKHASCALIHKGGLSDCTIPSTASQKCWLYSKCQCCAG